MVLGSLTLADGDGAAVSYRSEGARLRSAEPDSALLMLRLIPKESSVGRFAALNQRIGDLGKEIQRRRQAEEAAREQAEWLRVTLASIGDGVIVTNSAGTVDGLPASTTIVRLSASTANTAPKSILAADSSKSPMGLTSRNVLSS